MEGRQGRRRVLSGREPGAPERHRKKGMKFLSIGYGNAVAADRIVMIASPDSSPVKRLVAAAKDHNRVIDVSSGRKTRSVIVTDSEHIILSAVQVDTLASRLGAELVEDQPD